MTAAERLEAIRARLAAATPGPWKATPGKDQQVCMEHGGFPERGYAHWTDLRPQDAALIASAPSDLAWLLGEVERTTKAFDDCHDELGWLQGDVEEYLPTYELDDGSGDAANARETVEYAGQEIDTARGRVATLETELAAARARITEDNERLLAVLEDKRELFEERNEARARIAELEGQVTVVADAMKAELYKRIDATVVKVVDERNDAIAEREELRAHVERLQRDEATWAAALNDMHVQRDEWQLQVERLEQEAAAMREALEWEYANHHRSTAGYHQEDCDCELCGGYRRSKAALTPDAGRGWVSPEEHARVQGEAAAMREALAPIRRACGDVHPGADVHCPGGHPHPALSGDAGRRLVAIARAAEALVRHQDEIGEGERFADLRAAVEGE